MSTVVTTGVPRGRGTHPSPPAAAGWPWLPREAGGSRASYLAQRPLRAARAAALGALAALLPWGSSTLFLGHGLARALLLVAVIARVACGPLSRSRRGRLERADLLLLAFLGWAALSALWAIRADLSLGWAYALSYSLLLCLEIRLGGLSAGEWRAVGWCYAVGCLVSVAMLVHSHPAPIHTGERYTVEGVNPNNTSYALVTGLPVIWALMISGPRRGGAWRALPYLAIFAAIAVGTGLSGTRGAAIGLLVWLAVVLLHAVRSGSIRGIITLVGGLLLLTVVYTHLPDPLRLRLMSALDPSQRGDWSSRMVLWPLAWQAFASHPLAGIGAGTFPAITPFRVDVHNVFLGLGAQLGVVGLALYFLAVAYLLRGCFRPGVRQWPFWAALSLLGTWMALAMAGVWEASMAVWLGFGWVSVAPRLRHTRAGAMPAPGRARRFPGTALGRYATWGRAFPRGPRGPEPLPPRTGHRGSRRLDREQQGQCPHPGDTR